MKLKKILQQILKILFFVRIPVKALILTLDMLRSKKPKSELMSCEAN
ncbi:MAG: hypothetical protein IJX28_00735 [Clostridia bacterium]|nr:hypothetical protein [Clostridia bacterium]